LVEWPERAGTRLREPDLSLQLAYAGEGRSVSICPGSEAGQRVAAGLVLDLA
jgi:tRNA A37 threonylcarbamoyladenosine biosynthesis protein TsaE